VALSARAFRDGKPVDIPVMAMARQIAGERRYRCCEEQNQNEWIAEPFDKSHQQVAGLGFIAGLVRPP
jgi:hypothetical protein